MIESKTKNKMVKEVKAHFERICFPLDKSKDIRVKSSQYGPLICFTYFIVGIDKRLRCEREELFYDLIDVFVRTRNGDAESFLEDLNNLN